MPVTLDAQTYPVGAHAIESNPPVSRTTADPGRTGMRLLRSFRIHGKAYHHLGVHGRQLDDYNHALAAAYALYALAILFGVVNLVHRNLQLS